MYITAQGPRLRNDLYCVEWDVKLYYTIPYHTIPIPLVPVKSHLTVTLLEQHVDTGDVLISAVFAVSKHVFKQQFGALIGRISQLKTKADKICLHI